MTLGPSQAKRNLKVKFDKELKLKGIIDKSLRDKTVILKGLSVEDILHIKQLLTDEIKRQKKEESIQ